MSQELVKLVVYMYFRFLFCKNYNVEAVMLAVVLLFNISLTIFVFLIVDIGVTIIDILDWLYILVIVFLLKKL